MRAKRMTALCNPRHHDRHIEGNREAVVPRLKAETAAGAGTSGQN